METVSIKRGEGRPVLMDTTRGGKGEGCLGCKKEESSVDRHDVDVGAETFWAFDNGDDVLRSKAISDVL
jgi:hypothetical protein